MDNITYTTMFANYKDVMSVEEMSDALHIGKSTGYLLLSQNRINHIKVGKKYLIPKTAIIDFVISETYNKSTLNVADAEKGENI